MKKVIISSNTAWTVFNHRAGFIKKLQELGYEVHTVAPESNFTSIKNPGTIFHPVKTLERKGKNPFSDLLLLLEYYRIYKSINPDMVFSYTIKPNLYGAMACRFASVTAVCTVNGLGTAFDNPGSMTYRIVRLLFHATFKKVRAVVFQNPDDRDFFIKNKIVTSERVHLVNGSGVDLLKFSCKPLPLKPIFTLITRMLKNKGVYEFIEAGRRIHSEYPDAEFVLLGPADNDNPMGVKLSELEALDRKSGVYYAGATQDVRPFIEKSVAVVLPSYYKEGIPKTLIEALAVGRPVITTDTPGCRETVIDGKNGFFVVPKSADSLYNALKEFISIGYDAQVAMGLRSRVLAEEKFDEKKVISKYVEILEQGNN